MELIRFDEDVHISCQNFAAFICFVGFDFLGFDISGGVLEIGAQWAIETKDADAFERYMAQLKPYYLDYRSVF